MQTFLAIFTGVVAFFSVLVWRTYYKIEFLTGSLDSHSTLQLWFKIQEWNAAHPDKKIESVWWDPTAATITEEDPDYPAHGKPMTKGTIRFMLPLHLRKQPPSAWDQLFWWRWRQQAAKWHSSKS